MNNRQWEPRLIGRCGMCSQAAFEGAVKLTSTEGDWVVFHADCAVRAADELRAAGTRALVRERLGQGLYRPGC